MTYFDQLKTKHKNIEDAYRDYTVSQSLLKIGVCGKVAPDIISNGFRIQEIINEHLESIIKNKNNEELSKKLNLSSPDEIRKFWVDNEELLSFIGIDRGLYVDLITGMLKVKLDSSTKNMTWESLEKLMVEQKNNIPLIDSLEAKEKLEDIAKKYGLVSINLGRCRQTKESIIGLDERLDQLSKVIGCEKYQLGCNRFNISLDTEVFSSAGYSTQYGNNQKIYINERLGGDAFAHEWLHALDNMLANHYDFKETHASDSGKIKSIDELLKQSKEMVNESFVKINKDIKKDSLISLYNLVDRTDKLGLIKDVDGFKIFLKEKHEDVINKKWDKDKFFIESEKFQVDTRKSPCNSYLASELDLLDAFQKKSIKNSVFYEYAKIMDINLQKTGYMDYEYSVLPHEMLARSFEGYVGLKLEKMQLPNKIAFESEKNFFTPRILEVELVEKKWDNIMKDMCGMLNAIAPIEICSEVKSIVKSDVLGNIKKMKKKHLEISENESSMKLN
ncbi:hypothetical protein GW796_06455 [archaeon]|nr:hypothetical protein [archaeon]